MGIELTEAQKAELREEIAGGPRSMFGILGLKGQIAMTSETDSSLPIYEGMLDLFRAAVDGEDLPTGRKVDAAVKHLAFLVESTTIRKKPLAGALTDEEVTAMKLLGTEPDGGDVAARREALVAEEQAALDHERDRRDAFAAIVKELSTADAPAG